MSSEHQGGAGADHEAPGVSSQGYASPAPPRPRSTGRPILLGCLIALVGGAVVVVFLVVIFYALAVSFSGAAYTDGIYAATRVQELTVSGTAGDPKVAMIPIRGLLLSGGGMLTGRDPVYILKMMLEKARKDPDVRGVIFPVNSGGGGITACDVMHKAIRDYRDKTHVPVVVLMEDVAASGGYYVACGADYIIAHPTTITGSIGVLMPLFDASALLKKVGVADRTVKSGEFKTMGSMFAERTPEEWEREKAILEGVIRQMCDRFVEVIAEGRDLHPDDVRALADGRIYTSSEAKEKNLIDAIGYQEDAIEKVKELAGLESVHVVRYSRVLSLREMLLARAEARDLRPLLEGGLPSQLLHRPMYLWSPALPVAVE